MRIRRNLVAAAAFAVLAAGIAPASASEPESTDVKITTETGVKTITWKGEVSPVPTGAQGAATSSCAGDPDLEDVHTIKIDLGPRVYKSVVVEYTFQIAWEDSGQDLALSVSGPQGAVGFSDGGEPVETVPAINLDEGEYVVNACTFAAVGPTPYTGQLKMITKSKQRTVATTTPPASSGGSTGGGPAPSSGSSGSSGGTASPSPAAGASAPLAPAPSSSPRRPAAVAPATTPVTEPSPLPPVQAAPPAFISSGIDPLESAAPPPVATVAKETKSMPLGLAIGVCLIGLVGLGLALLVRRRRGLDQTPGTGIVPVSV